MQLLAALPLPYMSQLNTIPEAIEAIRRGEIIIVVDDEDRENEGDFLIAARHATPEVINFMATHGRGLICAPLLESRCTELELDLMVQSNNAAFETPFTISVDLMGHGCTTGISAHDAPRPSKPSSTPTPTQKSLGARDTFFHCARKPEVSFGDLATQRLRWTLPGWPAVSPRGSSSKS